MDGVKIMKYYKLNNTVYAYDEEQVAMGLADDKVELTVEELELHLNPPKTSEQLQEEVNAKSLAYLASTDWYVIRLQETGVAIPQEILDKRAEARLAIV